MRLRINLLLAFLIFLSGCNAQDIAVGDSGPRLGADRVVVDGTLIDRVDRLEKSMAVSLENAGEAKVEMMKNEPRVVLSKWDGEVRMGVKYKGFTASGSKRVGSDVMEWKNGTEEMHAYALPPAEGMEDGGFEIEIYLRKKPATNIFDFEIEGYENLDFFYQAELTQEELDAGAYRPDNVVGSYAVYHKAKRNHLLGEKNYATGKAYHIYRPKVIDADGREEWAELSYSSGLLAVTVSQQFLNTAKYPVLVDPTIGYTSIGASQSGFTSDRIVGSRQNPTIEGGGEITEVHAHIKTTSGTQGARGGVHDGIYNFLGGTDEVTINTTLQWYDFSSSTQVDGGVNYPVIFFNSDSTDSINLSFDSGSSGDSYQDTGETYPNWPDTSFASNLTQLFSIYADYTETCIDGAFCTEKFLSSGFYSWTAPTGVSEIYVSCWGGGGGGHDDSSAGGGGGGGGAWASSTETVTPGNSYTIYVGAGGGENSDGENSTFATTTLVADAGNGSNSAIGGAGGFAGFSTGSEKSGGGTGGNGSTIGDVGGGGGGAGGPSGDGIAGDNGVNNSVGGDGGDGNNGNGGAGGAGGDDGGAGGDGVDGESNSTGGGGGGGGDDNDGGGDGGHPGGGGGGAEVCDNGIQCVGADGQCLINFYAASSGGGEQSTPVRQSIFFF